jgi:transposase InsO family protein
VRAGGSTASAHNACGGLRACAGRLPASESAAGPQTGAELLRAERPNHVWALDFQFDETADLRRLKLLNIVDEHTREALAMRVGRTCDAEQVVAVIEAWENPFVESFNGRTRDELLNIEEFGNLFEALVVVEGWRREYNTFRPHSSLGGLTPAEYAKKWTINQP